MKSHMWSSNTDGIPIIINVINKWNTEVIGEYLRTKIYMSEDIHFSHKRDMNYITTVNDIIGT